MALDPAPRQGFVGGDGTALPFRCGVFRTVIALDVLEHVLDDRLLRSELSRVCDPGGIAWISVPSADLQLFPASLTAPAHRAWGHLRPGYTRREVEGFGASRVMPWNEPAYRALYSVLRVLAWLAPPVARRLIRLAFAFDSRHTEGDRGHYFCCIRVG